MQKASAAWKKLPRKERHHLKDAWAAKSSEQFERVGLALSEDACEVKGAKREALLRKLDLIACVVQGIRGGGEQVQAGGASKRVRTSKPARPKRPLNAPLDEADAADEAAAESRAAAAAEMAFREAFHLETGQIFRQDEKLASIDFVSVEALNRIMARTPADDLLSVSAWVKNRPPVLCPPGGPCECVMSWMTRKMSRGAGGQDGERARARYEPRVNRLRETLLEMMTGSDNAAEAAAHKMVRQLKACNAQKGAGPG